MLGWLQIPKSVVLFTDKYVPFCLLEGEQGTSSDQKHHFVNAEKM